MVTGWTDWRLFPSAENGDDIPAPIGPGVFEVRQVSSGDLVAFGHADNVARALARVAPRRRPWWAALSGRIYLPRHDLEYRAYAAASKAQARAMAERLIGRRQVYWRRALLTGKPAWAASS